MTLPIGGLLDNRIVEWEVHSNLMGDSSTMETAIGVGLIGREHDESRIRLWAVTPGS
jgi:hypothetical protein